MDYYQKYFKYKIKYLILKNQKSIGGNTENTNLKFYHIGKTQFGFKVNKKFNIKEATSIIFTKYDAIVITRPGKLFYINNYRKDDHIIKKIKDMHTESGFTSNYLEQGLLGITLKNNMWYLCYTISSANKEYAMELVVDEYEFHNKKLTKTKNILKIPFEEVIHHGGNLVLGPNDKIYLGVGDGGPQGDPYNKSQDLNSYRGKLLRIDPISGNIEIIARGLRQPWKFSFDNKQRIWIGDVGWNTSESIKLINNINRQYNFGWNYFEGSIQHKSDKKFSEFDSLIWEYPTNNKTGRSIIGGYFIDNLDAYIFGDYLGFIRAIKFNGTVWEEVAKYKLNTNEMIYSLGYDGNDIYILTDKQIYQLEIV